MDREFIKQQWFLVDNFNYTASDELLDQIEQLCLKYGLECDNKWCLIILHYYFNISSHIEPMVIKLSRREKFKHFR